MSHPIENIMHSSMEHIKALADVNTVIGDPLMTDGDTMILPVSKVSLGMLVGGGEYLSLSPIKKSAVEISADAEYPFIGASAVGMSLTPLAFLSVQNGSVRVLPAKQDCPTDRLIDVLPQLLDTAERLIREFASEGTAEKNNGRCARAGGCRHRVSESNGAAPAANASPRAGEMHIHAEYSPAEDEL